MKRMICLLPLLLFSLSLIACDDENDNPDFVSLSTDSLHFKYFENEKYFLIENSSDTDAIINIELTDCTWSLNERSQWPILFRMGPDTIAPGVDTVWVSLHRRGRIGIEYGKYRLSSNISESINFGIYFEIYPPLIELSSTRLDFGNDLDSLTFDISNEGNGWLYCYYEIKDSWINIQSLISNPPAGNLCGEGFDKILATVDRTPLPGGVNRSQIVIFNDYDKDTIDVMVTKGEKLWSYNFEDSSSFVENWNMYGNPAIENDSSYWSIKTDLFYDHRNAVWCDGFYENYHNDWSYYNNNMEAWMFLKEDNLIQLSNYNHYSITFDMVYEMEESKDFLYLLCQGEDGNWYYIDGITSWTGTNNFNWEHVRIEYSDFTNMPENTLNCAFVFVSDSEITQRGVYIDNLEVWGYQGGHSCLTNENQRAYSMK